MIGSCEGVLDDFEEQNINPEKRDPRFFQCYYEEDLAKYMCDSVLISFFGTDGSAYLKLNDELSFIGCDEGDDLEMLAFGDATCCIPRTYDLIYDMILDEDTIYQVAMFAGSEMNFDFISEDEKRQLAGYALLLHGKIKFDYSDLKTLMESQKMNLSSYEVELIRDTLLPYTDLNAYYWEIFDPIGTDEYRITHVNAATGEYTGISL